MKNELSKHRRNLFEVDNARNLSMHELVETFIPTQSFWRLLSAKHHVVLGARGQGKTALAKMLSHDHLALLAQIRNEPRARTAIRDQEFIGVYLPTRLEWVGGLKNKPWLNEKEREELFQWRLNIASCIAFIPIVSSCISTYVKGKVKQAQIEREMTHLLLMDWLAEPDLKLDNLMQLRGYLEDTDYRKQIQLLRQRAAGSLPSGEMPVGIAFGIDLFTPLRQGIRQLSRLLSINPDCTWLLCLDEAEFLEEIDHRIINSHMRAYPDNLFFKMTTMPYCHYTLATNIGAPLVNGQDFQYVNMDSDRVLTARTTGDPDTIGTLFGRTLFGKLIEASDPIIVSGSGRAPSINEVLGETEILDPRRKDWGPDSVNMKLLEKYGSKETVARAHRLAGTSKFPPAITRKVGGALILRKEVDELEGNKALTAYSGARMAIRCGDDNPRHLIRIFNALLMKRSRQQKRLMAIKRHKNAWISPEDQTRAMRALSASTLNQYRSFEKLGPELHAFLRMLGEYMHAYLHNKPLTTDQVTSVIIDDSISDKDWEIVRIAVGHGLLHLNIGAGNPDEIPWKEGTFHLAYALAPHFLLLPRRGKAAKLSTIQKSQKVKPEISVTVDKPKSNQLSMFDEGKES